MKRTLISLFVAIAISAILASPVLAERAQLNYGLTLPESTPNENLMKAAAVRDAYLTSQVPAIDKALKEITADNVISTQDWNKIIPLIDKFQSDRKEAIKIYGNSLITAELNPNLVKLNKLYCKPILNGRDPKGEIKALLAIMTGQDIKQVDQGKDPINILMALLIIVAIFVDFIGIGLLLGGNDRKFRIAGLVLLVIGGLVLSIILTV
ncbi:MAG: hypothetical protein AAB465_02330 [Patescibacteria group bacterium]